MSHGTNLITRESTIDKDICDVLLTHRYFETKEFKDQTHFINGGLSQNKYDEAILKFLDDQGMPYKDNTVEYWFQGQTTGEKLDPHCDFNHHVRGNPEFHPHQWFNTEKESEFQSPITIVAYIEVSDDLVGGELCVSYVSWKDKPQPHATLDELLLSPYEMHTPFLHRVLYFHGSKNFHWIEEVKSGIRKSVLINFWPLDFPDV